MSGCIVGDCPICEEWVYEGDYDDEILIRFEEFAHESCSLEYKRKYFKDREIKEVFAFIKEEGLMKKFHDYQERTRKKQEQTTLF